MFTRNGKETHINFDFCKMPLSKFLLLVFFTVSCTTVVAQVDTIMEKRLQIDSLNGIIKIDGIIDEEAWEAVPIANGFYQTDPNPGKYATQKTEVKMVYDHSAIYISARMYETKPDSINNFLSDRDDFGNADYFIVVFNTYRDGINGDGFAVSPAGVQIDIKYSVEGESNTWDAVWESATTIDEKGWVAELKIPYSALRFPEGDAQIWGVNFGRRIRRKRENSWWNYINPAIDGFLTQTGRVEGINNIEPPVRLFFFPYTSAYLEHNSSDGGSTSSSFNGGMDIKYGLNDAFTLDMTLIPDFGQARFDNQVLNLSQFEVQFNENRQFFTEGLELFNKAGIFYSRRVGGRPFYLNKVQDQLKKNEEIVDVNIQSQLLNATKISGRNSNGLGIGVFNAVESQEHAIVENKESGERRKELANPMTNYNVTVFDQVLRKNSFVTLTNTNVMRSGVARDANVAQLDWQLANKANKYAISGRGGVSHLFEESGLNDGYNYAMSVAKISGNFTANVNYEQISDEFNPRDLGFLNIRNIKRTNYSMRYAVYEPFSIFNFARHNFDIIYERLYRPDRFVNFGMSWSTVYSLKSFHAIGLNAAIEPIKTNDYFETRSFQQYYKYPINYSFGGFFSSDYSRPFALDINMQRRIFDEPSRHNFSYEISPRFRPNDKLFIVLSYNDFVRNNEMGYVNYIDDSIYFGRRKVVEKESAVRADYTFNNKMSMALNLRHYWSTVTYNRFNLIDRNNGDLLDTDYSAEDYPEGLSDASFNAFNVDLVFNWRFAPGSDISVVWKNIILSQGEPLELNYYENIEQVLNAPQINNFSIKVLYFIDYLNLKRS